MPDIPEIEPARGRVLRDSIRPNKLLNRTRGMLRVFLLGLSVRAG